MCLYSFCAADYRLCKGIFKLITKNFNKCYGTLLQGVLKKLDIRVCSNLVML